MEDIKANFFDFVKKGAKNTWFETYQGETATRGTMPKATERQIMRRHVRIRGT